MVEEAEVLAQGLVAELLVVLVVVQPEAVVEQLVQPELVHQVEQIMMYLLILKVGVILGELPMVMLHNMVVPEEEDHELLAVIKALVVKAARVEMDYQ